MPHFATQKNLSPIAVLSSALLPSRHVTYSTCWWVARDPARGSLQLQDRQTTCSFTGATMCALKAPLFRARERNSTIPAARKRRNCHCTLFHTVTLFKLLRCCSHASALSDVQRTYCASDSRTKSTTVSDWILPRNYIDQLLMNNGVSRMQQSRPSTTKRSIGQARCAHTRPFASAGTHKIASSVASCCSWQHPDCYTIVHDHRIQRKCHRRLLENTATAGVPSCMLVMRPGIVAHFLQVQIIVACLYWCVPQAQQDSCPAAGSVHARATGHPCSGC